MRAHKKLRRPPQKAVQAGHLAGECDRDSRYGHPAGAPWTPGTRHIRPFLPSTRRLALQVLKQTAMPVGECAQCLVLLEDVTRASKHQMTAISQHNTAVQNDAGDEELARLKHQADFWGVERQEAVDRYRFHLRSHQQAVMRAGS